MSSRHDHFDCAVIGGGIIGLSLADELAAVNKRVVVIDYQAAPRAASWAAAGILPPPIKRALHDPLERLRYLSQQLYPGWLERLATTSDVPVEMELMGGIYLARTAGERFALQAAVDQWQQDGVRVESLSPQALRQCEPQLGHLPANCLIFFLPDEAQVRPPRLLKALRRSIEQQSATIIHATHPVRWHDTQSDRLALCLGKQIIGADHVCIASGPWSTELLKSLDVTLALEPRRGQMVMWQTETPLLQRIVNEGPRYLVARADGKLLAGSTVEDVGFDCRTTDDAIQRLSSFARSLLPHLGDASMTWAALRPMSIDGLPYLGRVPGNEQITVATGHFRSGIHLAPATARLLRQLICHQPLEIDLAPFSINR